MASNNKTRPNQRDAVRQLFDDYADHYATQREHLPYFQAQMNIVLSMLSGEAGTCVLDIGCAAGAEIKGLRALGFEVIGIDLSERMVQACQERVAGDDQVEVFCGDTEHLPLPWHSVDHVVCMGVFEFLHDYSLAVAEIARVLRPGGVVVFAIPSEISLYNVSHRLAERTVAPIWRMAKRALGRPTTGSDGHPFTRNLCVPWRFRQLLRSCGLIAEQSAFSNYFVYPLDRFPQLNVKVAELLEPLASVPLLKFGASVYLVCARKTRSITVHVSDFEGTVWEEDRHLPQATAVNRGSHDRSSEPRIEVGA